jgi:hypothetical protein
MRAEYAQPCDPEVKPVHYSEDAASGYIPGDSVATSATLSSPRAKIQLRPVGHPSPVTQLFEYTVKAWNNQKGDHCTYRYISSRDPAVPMEMIATVLVRLPNKQPLYVKDNRSRASRVIAQNAVAQLALEKLALEDADLSEKLEAIKREQENAPQRQHHPGSPWRSRQQYRHPFPNHMYHPPQYPPYFIPTENPEGGEFLPPPPPPMFYPMVPLQSFESDDGAVHQDQLMTPTYGAPYSYGYAPMAPFLPPPEMMYYPPPTMMPHHMMVPQLSEEKEPSDETTQSNQTVY